MLPVSIEGVRRNFGISSAYHYTVTLIDETGQRIFLVGVERHEALPIVAALHNLTLTRPQAIHVLVETLQIHGITLKEVHLEQISWARGHYLFSVTLLWQNSDTSEIAQKREMRAGDALGLALLMNCPLLLSDSLAQQCVVLPEGMTPELSAIHDLLKREGIVLAEGKKLRMGYSKTPMRDALVKEFKAANLGKAPPFPEEDLSQRKKTYLAFLLREDGEQDARRTDMHHQQNVRTDHF